MLYNQLEKGIQMGDPLQAVRHLVAPTEAVAQLCGIVRHHYELIAESTERKNKLTVICDELFPELTRLLRNPNLPTALALRERFPTPADLAAATFWELRAARGRTCNVSDAKLQGLQRVAAQSIGTKAPHSGSGVSGRAETAHWGTHCHCLTRSSSKQKWPRLLPIAGRA